MMLQFPGFGFNSSEGPPQGASLSGPATCGNQRTSSGAVGHGCGFRHVPHLSKESGNKASRTFSLPPLQRHRMKPIRKAVFPVAGLGTRFLPATKAMPKEMLPVVDRPLIQHVVDEAAPGRHRAFHLRHRPQQGRHRGSFRPPVRAGNDAAGAAEATGARICSREDLPGPGSTSFTRQQEPLGLGHAVWCARELIGHEPFALLLPDVLVQHERGCLAQMIDAARELGEQGQHRRRRGSAARARRPVRRGRRRRAQGQGVLDHQHGGEAAARAGAVEPDPYRPLHPAAGNPRHSGQPGARRRRRNPAHRRHDRAGENASRSTG